MAQKSAQGKTEKYSNVVKSVKNSQSPEEPRIKPEQVISAFRSFGFEPNERNHNDIGYWTTKPISDGPKLMEELHKRRMEINKKEDDDNRSKEEKVKADEKSEEDKKRASDSVIHRQSTEKVAMPRLSDEDINALFDEYGLPSPDPEWARNHLPNDPKKIRAILEMERKTADDMLKKHSKNTVNSMPETPKMMAGGMGGPSSYRGMGGPAPAIPAGPMGIQGGMVPQDEPATPFFVGDHALVKITSPSNPNQGTLWLVDKKRKVLRPILSEKALENTFEDPEEAMNSIVVLSSKALGPGGELEGFTPLNADKGVNLDGSMDDIEFSPGQIQKRYGKQSDPVAENKALSMLDGVLGNINNQPQV